uniref:Uncharacterized protein n=1 Tax=Tanacetum cinerariifolium TaxID=118510 RepID=A0A6L2KTK3_TANCI|nr:hypothetical protein [Tanacetum cinerariifolium]
MRSAAHKRVYAAYFRSSESNQEENEEEIEDDKEEEEDEFVKTPSNDTDDEDETKIKDKTEGGEDEGIDYTTNQFNDDVNVRLNEPATADEGFIQKEDAHVTLFTVPQKTEVPDSSSSHSSDLAFEFLNFSDIPHIDAEIVSPMDVHVHHEKVSNFAPLVIKSMVTESLEHAVLAKESLQPKSTYVVAASLIEFELKKILIDKMDESQSYLTVAEHIECYDGFIKSYDLNKNGGLKKRKTSKDAEPTKGLKYKESKSGSSKGTKSQLTSSGKSVHADEPEFEVADSNMPQDQEENQGNEDEEPKGKKLDWDNPEGGDYPFDLTKPLPLVMNGNRQMVLVDYFFNNDLNDSGRALRMFTRSMVIQNRVEDLQLGVKSYQKKINVTKRDTIRPDIRKKDPYTPYQDPQGFIYVNTQGRNRLMRSVELYKFSDGTLTRLRTLLDDIIKNIRMEYLPRRDRVHWKRKELIS